MKPASIFLNHAPGITTRIREVCRPLIRYAVATVACLAFLIMGSENPWFPWPNVAALGVLAAIVVIFNHTNRQTEN